MEKHIELIIENTCIISTQKNASAPKTFDVPFLNYNSHIPKGNNILTFGKKCNHFFYMVII